MPVRTSNHMQTVFNTQHTNSIAKISTLVHQISLRAIDYALTKFLSSATNVQVNFTRYLLQIEDMRCKLNVTLLKAVLQINQAVALMDDRLSNVDTRSALMDVVVAELEVEEEIRWKQKQVIALIAVCLCFFRVS